ncbi:MAG TPA: hypothetical protein VGP82_23565, partial [Ktedonobacterales bacterium]|nr:hypothetical protein [Ktedonobacterales bacterium]
WTPGGGSRPHAVVQQRFAWLWRVGFVHPASICWGRTGFHRASAVSIELVEVELAAFTRQVGAGPGRASRSCSCWIVLAGIRACRCGCWEHVHLLFLPAYSPEVQPAEHLWPLTNTVLIKTVLIKTVLINRHFADLEDLEEAHARRCVALQRRRDLIRSATRFHWWPHYIKQRQGPRTP